MSSRQSRSSRRLAGRSSLSQSISSTEPTYGGLSQTGTTGLSSTLTGGTYGSSALTSEDRFLRSMDAERRQRIGLERGRADSSSLQGNTMGLASYNQEGAYSRALPRAVDSQLGFELASHVSRQAEDRLTDAMHRTSNVLSNRLPPELSDNIVGYNYQTRSNKYYSDPYDSDPDR